MYIQRKGFEQKGRKFDEEQLRKHDPKVVQQRRDEQIQKSVEDWLEALC
jgi:hypothetical protein